MSKFKSGFAPVPVLLVLFLAALTAIPVLRSPVTTRPSDAPAVEGVLIARGGEESEKASGSKSDSSGGSSGGTSTAPSPTAVQPASNREVEVKKPEKIEKPETETEPEDEVEIENEVEKPEVEKVEVKLATGAGTLEVETEGTKSGSLKIKSENGKIEFESRGVLAGTNFPLTLDKTTGQLFVNTPNGPRLIRVLPDQAASAARAAGVQNEIEKIELLESNGDLTFQIKGKKTGNLLGLFPVSANVESKVDSTTGQVLSVTEPRWLQLLSGLIK